MALAPRAHAQAPAQLDENPVPDLFASLMSLTLTQEVSGGTFRIASSSPESEDTRVNTYHLPWRSELADGELRLDGAVGVLTARDRLARTTTSGESVVRQDWLALGAQLGLSAGVELGSAWELRPGVALALAHLANDASYNAAAQADIAPGVDGVLTNWDASAIVASASLTLEHPRELERLDVGFVARAVAATTHVFGSTSEVLEGTDGSEFLLARVEIGGPIGLPRAGVPGPGAHRAGGAVGWDASLAGVRLLDIDREALGFHEFLQLGAGVSFTPWSGAPALRLSGTLVDGPDITGWSLGLGFAP